MNCQWPTGASAVSCLYSLEPTRLRCVTFCYSNSPLLLSFSSAVLCVFLRIFRLASCFPRVSLTFLRVPPCFFVFLRVSPCFFAFLTPLTKTWRLTSSDFMTPLPRHKRTTLSPLNSIEFPSNHTYTFFSDGWANSMFNPRIPRDS